MSFEDGLRVVRSADAFMQEACMVPRAAWRRSSAWTEALTPRCRGSGVVAGEFELPRATGELARLIQDRKACELARPKAHARRSRCRRGLVSLAADVDAQANSAASWRKELVSPSVPVIST